MMMTLRRLWIQITADRRRFGVLCGVLVVGLLLWSRLLIVSELPRTAIADDVFPPVVSDVEQQVSDKRSAPVSVTLSRTPQRDPFVISAPHFPNPTPVPHIAPEPSKSDPQPAEGARQAEARLVERLRAHVARLHLEVVMSGRPLVVIDGTTYRVGERVPAGERGELLFTLAEIRQRSVVLDYEGRKFELSMTAPKLEAPINQDQ